MSCSFRAAPVPFQSTLPVRGATANAATQMREIIFQSTLPVRGATRKRPRAGQSPKGFQSTLPVRGATIAPLNWGAYFYISIHAPRAGSDPLSLEEVKLHLRFQSTLPVRGATAVGGRAIAAHQFQSTLPVRGATSDTSTYAHGCVPISIHAPRAGSDRENSDHYPDFQIILVWLFVSGRIWLLILNISQSI